MNEALSPKKFWLRLAIILGSCFFGIVIVCSGLFWFLLHDLCANDEVVEFVSPNGQLKAVTFRRNCGATTSYITCVSVLSARHKLPNESGNVFTANHERSLSVRWIDDRHLSISGETQTEFLHLPELRGVRITYD